MLRWQEIDREFAVTEADGLERLAISRPISRGRSVVGLRFSSMVLLIGSGVRLIAHAVRSFPGVGLGPSTFGSPQQISSMMLTKPICDASSQVRLTAPALWDRPGSKRSSVLGFGFECRADSSSPKYFHIRRSYACTVTASTFMDIRPHVHINHTPLRRSHQHRRTRIITICTTESI